MNAAEIILMIYFLFLVFVFVGWKRLPYRSISTATMKVSVIIPIRNETENIGWLLNDLRQQRYNNFEVIVVNDHSTDDIDSVVRNYPEVKWIVNESEGKKSAITTGVKHASGKIIITTDADCRVGTEWISSMISPFENENNQMVIGPVKLFSDGSIFQSLQQLEFMSLIGSTGAFAAVNKPVFCNGANLAYRRESFSDVGGYQGNETIPSGDDEFLMRKFLDRNLRIVFNKIPSAIVSTKPQKSFSDFVSQRLRWAGKWRRNNSILSKSLALFVWLTQLAFIFILLSIAFDFSTRMLCLIFIKIILEFMLFRCLYLFFSERFRISSLIVIQFVYPVYVLFIGILANLVKPKWKERPVS